MLFFFSSCKEKPASVQRDIVITGSESEKSLVQYLANHFVQANKQLNIKVRGGGSESGINALKKGECDIANSSRVFESSDYEAFKTDSVKQAIVAVDAIAIITHPSLGVNGLNVRMVSEIYSGKIKNWQEVGGPDLDIMPVGRKEGSGTRQYMKHRLNLDDFTPIQQEFKRYEEIVAHVAKNKNAIGYVSLKYALDSERRPLAEVSIVPVSIEGVEPQLPNDNEAIVYGDYPFIRPLFQYYLPGQNESIEKFIRFELSVEGQQLLQKIGYYPINDYHKQINKLKM
ncbi:MAG TPA: phosphate ABC transporter substrate-binding protein [Bacteroidia bacterium]